MEKNNPFQPISSFVKTHFERILVYGGIAILIFFVLKKWNAPTPELDAIQKLAAKNKKEIDSLKAINKKLDDKISKFEQKSKELEDAVKTNDSQIDKLKQDEKAKKRDFDTYTATMWEKYFTDRYKDPSKGL